MDNGTVTFFDSEQGWGLISSEAVPDREPVRVESSVIEMEGYRELAIGQAVSFAYEPAERDGYRFRATRVLPA